MGFILIIEGIVIWLIGPIARASTEDMFVLAWWVAIFALIYQVILYLGSNRNGDNSKKKRR